MYVAVTIVKGIIDSGRAAKDALDKADRERKRRNEAMEKNSDGDFSDDANLDMEVWKDICDDIETICQEMPFTSAKPRNPKAKPSNFPPFNSRPVPETPAPPFSWP